MNALITKNKPVIKFLAIFSSSYVLLSLLYYIFLNTSTNPDFLTRSVSNQTIELLNLIGYETNSITNSTKDFINLYVRGKNIAGISEGCNAISIMILFIAFILSFTKKIKSTLLFALLGLITIHIMNLVRIIILVVCLFHYPQYSESLHNYVFPAMIYGVVFILWMVWVNSFQKTKRIDAI